MARRPVRFSVGSQRISKSSRGTSGGRAAVDVRKQFQEIENNFAEFINSLKDVMPEAIEFALQPIFDRSQELVPVDTSKLKNSGFIESKRTASGATGRVGYGRGGNPPYALTVHENLEFQHKPPTQARFLMQAIEEHFFTLLNRVTLFAGEKTGISSAGSKTRIPTKAERSAALKL